MARVTLCDLSQKIFSPFKAVSGKSDTVTVDESGIPNILFVDRVKLAPCNLQCSDNRREQRYAEHGSLKGGKKNKLK